MKRGRWLTVTWTGRQEWYRQRAPRGAWSPDDVGKVLFDDSSTHAPGRWFRVAWFADRESVYVRVLGLEISY